MLYIGLIKLKITKFFYLTITLLVISHCATGQIYSPIKENTLWRVEHHDNAATPCFSYATYYYFLQGDTLLQSTNYKKLFYRSETLHCITQNNSYIYWGGIRQDTVSKKVYCNLPSFNHDSLLYNFNLNINDTLPNTIINPPPWVMIITSVDSIQLLDGTFRRRLGFSESVGGFQHFIIESIGANTGLLESHDPSGLGEYYNLSCLKVDSSLLFSNDPYCNILLSSNDWLNAEPSIFAFYDRALNSVKIKSKIPIEKIVLYSLTGREAVVSTKISNDFYDAIFSVDIIPSGLFLISIVSNNGVIENFKLFK
jgi:hypothetical protein